MTRFFFFYEYVRSKDQSIEWSILYLSNLARDVQRRYMGFVLIHLKFSDASDFYLILDYSQTLMLLFLHRYPCLFWLVGRHPVLSQFIMDQHKRDVTPLNHWCKCPEIIDSMFLLVTTHTKSRSVSISDSISILF